MKMLSITEVVALVLRVGMILYLLGYKFVIGHPIVALFFTVF